MAGRTQTLRVYPSGLFRPYPGRWPTAIATILEGVRLPVLLDWRYERSTSWPRSASNAAFFALPRLPAWLRRLRSTNVIARDCVEIKIGGRFGPKIVRTEQPRSAEIGGL